jgi:hypothetical protein
MFLTAEGNSIQFSLPITLKATKFHQVCAIKKVQSSVERCYHLAFWTGFVNQLFLQNLCMWHIKYSVPADIPYKHLFSSLISTGCAIAQVVRCQPVTADAWVGSKASPCGIFGGQSGTGTDFFPPSTLVFPVSIIPPLFHTHLSITNTIPVKS